MIMPETEREEEARKWNALETTAGNAFIFWKSFFTLKRGPSNDQELTAADEANFKMVIRCVSWVESKHGTAGANQPAVDPMQSGNPGDKWWLAINKPEGTQEDRFIDSQGKGYWAAELRGVTDANPGFPANGKLSTLTDRNKGHLDPKFNNVMSFYWGVLYLIQRINTIVANGKTYKCGDCSKDRMINGAVAYNGGGDAAYRGKINRAWALIEGTLTPTELLETFADLFAPQIFVGLKAHDNNFDSNFLLIESSTKMYSFNYGDIIQEELLSSGKVKVTMRNGCVGTQITPYRVGRNEESLLGFSEFSVDPRQTDEQFLSQLATEEEVQTLQITKFLAPSIEGAAANWTKSCAALGDVESDNCAHFLSNAFIAAGYTELTKASANANIHEWCDWNDTKKTPLARPIRAKEMWEWFKSKATETRRTKPDGEGFWAVFQWDPSYSGGHVLIYDSDKKTVYGTGVFWNWKDQFFYKW